MPAPPLYRGVRYAKKKHILCPFFAPFFSENRIFLNVLVTLSFLNLCISTANEYEYELNMLAKQVPQRYNRCILVRGNFKPNLHTDAIVFDIFSCYKAHTSHHVPLWPLHHLLYPFKARKYQKKFWQTRDLPTYSLTYWRTHPLIEMRECI